MTRVKAAPGRKKAAAPSEALIVVDMLNDFCEEGAPLYVPSTREAIPNIARELRRTRGLGAPIIFVCDSHAYDDPEFAYWPPHAVAGTDGAAVVAELSPLPGEHVVEKTTLSSFLKTRLDAVLRKHRVKDVAVAGCVTEICILYTVFDLISRGFRVRVVKDCVAGLDPKMHAFALDHMERVLRASVA